MKRALYFHGYKSRANDEVHRWLKQYLPGVLVTCHTMTSIPSIDIPKFRKRDYSKYDVIIGLSMGGLYAYNIEGVPVVLINPGFGAHLKTSLRDIKELEDYRRKDLDNIYCFQANRDSHYNWMVPRYLERCGSKNYFEFDGVHVPTEENISKIIAPFIMNLLY
jgi:hypothetical protein